ncbi:MAG TPA: hypothetical protein VLM79_24285 [Kofleriaceae bacterium]|nr:hypothetical protein [Kofleriaceae bacterium]
MTKQRDLKRLVRDRQARTGETYVTALRHIRTPRSATGTETVPVVELVDITAIGEPLGMRCRVMVQPELAECVDVTAVLRQLRSVLLTTTPDPDFDLMRAVVLRGECPYSAPPTLADGLRFLVRLRAGIGGVCPSGRIVAFSVAGSAGMVQVVFMLWITHVRSIQLRPTLVVTTTDFSLDDIDDISILPFSYLAGVP